MTVVTMNADRTTWTALNADAQRVQVFGGRILVAASAAPDPNDWQVWPEGAVVDITAVKYGRALDTTPTWVVALPA